MGPAPVRPFTQNRFHNWHRQWTYGNGDIGNQGVHQIDLARWGLGVALPKKVQSMGGHYMFDDDQETPNTQVCAFDYSEEKNYSSLKYGTGSPTRKATLARILEIPTLWVSSSLVPRVIWKFQTMGCIALFWARKKNLDQQLGRKGITLPISSKPCATAGRTPLMQRLKRGGCLQAWST